MKISKHDPDVPDNRKMIVPLLLSFYKTYGTFENPETRKIVDVDIIKCHEFPNFTCMFESKMFVESKFDWHQTVLAELVDYLTHTAKGFAEFASFPPEGVWVDDYTAKLELV